MNNAAKLFAKLYSLQYAQKMGFNIDESFNLQSAEQQEAAVNEGINKYALDLGDFLGKLNKGMMAEMQQNP